MNNTCTVMIHDELLGNFYVFHHSKDIEDAIYVARMVDKNIIGYLEDTFDIGEIHSYHKKNPHKRFDVIVSVDY